MSNLISHAKKELELIGYDLNSTEENPNKWMVESVLELIQPFANQGHSGSSAPECISLFSQLAKFEPLSPLTCNDDLFQNNRCSHVFKENNTPYDIYGNIFVEPNGIAFTSNKSKVYISFPYIPKSEYIKVSKQEE
jgi:hypothetical protein